VWREINKLLDRTYIVASVDFKRIRLVFAPGVVVSFSDRVEELRVLSDLARRGHSFPVVVFGPEGCGKTALLRQMASLLREEEIEVVYVDTLEEDVSRAVVASPELRQAVVSFAEAAVGPLGKALAYAVIAVVSKILSKMKSDNLVIIVDEVFQAVGLENAAMYVKKALNLLEYPSDLNKRALILLTTSEGVSRREVARHGWADIKEVWNLNYSGLRELYSQLPEPKPDYSQVWRITGGNPRILKQYYMRDWDTESLVQWLVVERNLRNEVAEIVKRHGKDVLVEGLENPDLLLKDYELYLELEKLSLVIDLHSRDYTGGWIGAAPSRDLELGIGDRVAWQTPLHKEAVRRIIQQLL